ncbi:MAG TPA: hypothetical protein VD767_01735 [Thermomicrobiales bacterium]|nr:hypothetical protein [Thermomicrobiales bacterium]
MCLASVVLAGCGSTKDPEPTPTPEPTSIPEPTATAVPEAALGDVAWSTAITSSGAPDDELDTFFREEDVIYASVEATNLKAGDSLAATWSINGMPIDGASSTVTIESDTPSGWASFSLTWNGAALWPTGTLEVMIASSTGLTATGSIPIVSGQ